MMLNKIAEEFVRRTEVVCIRVCLKTLLLIFRNLLQAFRSCGRREEV